MFIEVKAFNKEDFDKICEALDEGKEVSLAIVSDGVFDPMLDMEAAHYAMELETRYGTRLQRRIDEDTYHCYKLRG